jgi:hypothetical protein
MAGGAIAATALTVAACSSSSTSVTSPTATRCSVQLTQSPSTMDAGGGRGQIAIAVNRECTWEARSEADWLTLAAPTSGQGEANLGYSAMANPAVSIRRGAVVVNDQRIEVAQAAAVCQYSLSAPGGSAGAGGGTLSVAVTAQPTCRWTAVSQTNWVRVDAGREGDGQGVVTMSVVSNTGPAREGAVVVAGQTYSVSQSAAGGPGPQPGCELSVSPQSESFAASGGDGTVRVTASGSNCGWSAASNVPWITVAATAGNGNGSVRYSVAANTGAARTGTMNVAGTTISVTQAAAAAAPCQYDVSPTSESFSANGGEGSVRIRAAGHCAWSAVSSAGWISVTAGAGSGNGNARYSVAANTGAARSGTLTVGGTAVSITQEAAPQPSSTTLHGDVEDLSGQCPNLTFTLERRLVRTNSCTQFDERCDHLRNRRDVTVWGTVQSDSSVLAQRVERH